MFKYIYNIFRNFKLTCLFLLVLTFFLSFINIKVQLSIKNIIDNFQSNKIDYYLLIFISLLVLQILSNILYGYFKNSLTYKSEMYYKNSIFKKVLIDNSDNQNLKQVWTKDIEDLKKLSIDTIFNNILSFSTAILACLQIVKISILSLIIIIGFSILISFPIKIIGKKNKSNTLTLRETEIKLNEFFYSVFDNFVLYKTYNMKDRMICSFSDISDTYIKHNIKQLLVSNFYRIFSRVLQSIIPATVIILLTIQIMNEEISAGELILVISLTSVISKPILEISTIYILFKELNFKAKELLNHTIDYTDLQVHKLYNNFDYKEIIHNLKLENITFRNGNHSIIENITLSINRGSKITLIGKSGSGKSTLSKVISGILKPTSGNLYVNNEMLTYSSYMDKGQQIYYSPSTPYIIKGTLLENINLLTGSLNMDINLTQTEYNILFKDFDKGLDSEISPGGKNISGGQKKIIEFFRALSCHSEFIIFDEVLTGLDKEKKDVLVNIMLKSSKTIILITHDLSYSDLFDNCLMMDSKSVFSVGGKDEYAK